MDNKIIVLITGANQGVGYQTAKILLQKPNHHVLIGSRTASKGQEAAISLQKLDSTQATTEAIEIDVTKDESVEAAAALVSSTYGRLDVLVNNAGICPASSFAGQEPNLPSPGSVLRETLNTNCIGPVVCTEAFLPLLRKSASPRLVFVGSSTGSLTFTADPTHPLHRAGRSEYRASKAALNFLMLQYHLALKEEGFKVFVADPGLNATSLTGADEVQALIARGATDPSVGGERVAKVIRGDRDGHVGKVCGEYGDMVVCPW